MDFKKGITYKERTKLRNFKAALQSDIDTALKNHHINADDFRSKNRLHSHHDRHVHSNPLWVFTGKQERSSGDGKKRILFPLLASDILLNEYRNLYDKRKNLRIVSPNLDNEERIQQITNKLNHLKQILIDESINEYNRLANELMNMPATFSSIHMLTADNVVGLVTNLYFGQCEKRTVNLKFRVSVVPGPRNKRLHEYVIYEIIGDNELKDAKNRTANEKRILSFGLTDSFFKKVSFGNLRYLEHNFQTIK